MNTRFDYANVVKTQGGNSRPIVRILLGVLIVALIVSVVWFALPKQSQAPAGMSEAEMQAAIQKEVDRLLAEQKAQEGTVVPPEPAVAVEEGSQVAGVFNGTLQQDVLPDQGGSREHIVKAGENLGTIAQQYSVTVEGIAALNGIKGPEYVIFVDQVLKIPESTSTFSGQVPTINLRGPQFAVIKSILGPVGYSKATEDDQDAHPWPAQWETVARPKFEHINGEPVWRSQDVLPGEKALYVGSGIDTPMGHFVGCSAGYFSNGTNQTITIWVLSMSEIVVGDTDNYDAMAQELALRTSSGNQCSTSYLGNIPLH